MLQIAIPGFRDLRLEHLVLDFNGTLAVDGALIPGVGERLERLAEELTIHILTADTFGNAAAETADLPCRLVLLDDHVQDAAKRNFVERLGADVTVAIGNGRNDRLMLKAAALGVAVLQTEGTAAETLLAADVVTTDILSALDLLSHPKRLTATLRC